MISCVLRITNELDEVSKSRSRSSYQISDDLFRNNQLECSMGNSRKGKFKNVILLQLSFRQIHQIWLLGNFVMKASVYEVYKD